MENASNIKTSLSRRWLIANSFSIAVHIGLILVACVVAAPQHRWETMVKRGQASVLMLSVAADDVDGKTDLEVEPLPLEIEQLAEPVEQQMLPPTRQMSRFSNPEFSASQLGLNDSLGFPAPIHAIPEPTLPNVEDRIVARPKKRLANPEWVKNSAAPPPVNASAGASFDTPPRLLPENAPPVYPVASRIAGHEGRVILAVKIVATGSVLSITLAASSGFAALDQAAMNAVRQWRFSPAGLNGVAVAAEILVPIRFRISETK